METRKIRNGGFTLLETLLTVAILIILMALSAVGVARYKDYLDVTELDNAARDIYMAAENRAVLLQNSGASVKLLSTGSGGSGSTVTLSSAVDKTKLAELLPTGTIDPALWKGDFRIVYDQTTGHVKEVFYAEKGTIDDSNLEQFRKDRSERVSLFRGGKTLVGYYGSDVGASIVTKPLPTPGVEVFIDNGEELTLKVRFTKPAGTLPADVNYTPSVTLRYPGTAPITLLTGSISAPSYPSRSPSDVVGGFGTGTQITYTWVLDSLAKDAEGRSQQFKDLGLTGLGKNFTVTAGLTLKADGWIESAYFAEGTDNSLFAKKTGDGDTAYIANLRHLQNLCADFSKVRDGITGAKQLNDIDCEKYYKNDGTTVLDGAYKFTPITNGNLTEYDGQNNYITNLTTTTSAAAGLFGTVSNDLKVLNTRVCWTKPENLVQPADKPTDYLYAVSGNSTGGMIGSITGGDVRIENSFAATTVKGTAAAGGLVGSKTGGTLTIQNSYADCYLKAGADANASAAGLVGSGTGSADDTKLQNSYAAGFIVEPGEKVSTAGLVNGSATATNCYSVVRVIKENADGTLEKPAPPATPMYSGWNESSPGSAFYLSKAEDVTDAVKAALGGDDGAFEYEDATPETHVYDLRHQLNPTANPTLKLTPPYPFPGLKGTDGTALPHYGDWAELEGSSGGARLVYYEKYEGFKDPGVWGADADGEELRTLKNDTDNPVVTKDGYALVFEGTVPSGYTYTIEYGDTQYNTRTWTLKISDLKWENSEGFGEEAKILFPVTVGGKTYTLVPLPDWIVLKAWKNMSQSDSKFYRKLVCGKDADAVTYWFNPHFAKTVVKPDQPDKVPAEPTHNEANAIIVRTIRHLWHLSTIGYTSGSLDYQVYVHNKAYYFKQELDLGLTYDVAGLDSFPQAYRSIGSYERSTWESANIFQGTYDGQGKSIKGVGYGDGAEIEGRYIGLFGYSSGTLKNIVYHMSKFEADSSSSTIYFGGLAAYNEGTVEDCKVIIKTGELSTKERTLSDDYVYAAVGGLVGYNKGDIKGSRVIGVEDPGVTAVVALKAVKNQISMDTRNQKFSYLHVGGLVGYNDGGAISFPGNVSVKVGALTNSGEKARVGGLAGAFKGKDKAIENYKAEVDTLTSRGEYAWVGGLVGLNEGSVIRNCTIGAPKLVIEAVGSNVGGLVGNNKGTILEGLDAAAGKADTVTENIWAIQLDEVSVPALSYYGSGTNVGGLVGSNDGTVTGKPKGDSGYSITVGKVSEAAFSANVGGLIGENSGTVKNCKAKVTNLEGRIGAAGGLAGSNGGTVTDCAADVDSLKKTGSSGSYVGGLVGSNSKAVTRCTAKVTTLTSSKDQSGGGQYGSVGGLVGINSSNTASITDCEATVGSLANERYGAAVGGLVGTNGNTTQNSDRSVLKNCKATVTGALTNSGDAASVAGLAGGGYGKILNCQATVTGDLTNSGKKASVAGLTGYVGNSPASWQREYLGDIGGCTATVTGDLTNSGEEASVGGLVGYTTIAIHAYTDEETGKEIHSSATVGSLTNSGERANVGGLVGYSGCEGDVKDGVEQIIMGCAATVGPLTNEGKSANVGGLVGYSIGSSSTATYCPVTIKNCTATVEKLLNTGNSEYYSPYHTNTVPAGVGGLVGQNRSAGVEGCTATVKGDLTNEGQYAKVGGLVGFNCSSQSNVIPSPEWHPSKITDCTAKVTGALTNSGQYGYVGGLAGMNTGILQGTIGEDGTSGCRATVTTLTNEGQSAYVGGLVGYSSNLKYRSDGDDPWPVAVTGCAASVGETLTNSGYRAYVGGLVGNNGSSSTVRNCAAHIVTLANQIYGAYVGGLAGGNSGTIAASEGEKCFAEVGTLTNATTDTTDAAHVGGLVGWNRSTIQGVRTGSESTCFATVEKLETAGTAHVGGLVGENDRAAVEGCTATVTELLNTGNTNNRAIAVGGLVGNNQDTAVIKDCAAMVTTLTNSSGYAGVGGLVGWNLGTIGGDKDDDKNAGCYAEVGTLTNEGASANVGGLAGYNQPYGIILECKTTKVDTLTNTKIGKSANVGGLVGYNNGGRVEESGTEVGALTNIGPEAKVGGLVGYNDINGASGQRQGLVKGCCATVATLTNDINKGDDWWNQNNGAYVGGLVGDNCSGLVEDCTAAITGGADGAIALVNRSANAHVGGLVGHNEKNSTTGVTPPIATISNCVVTVAGISNEEGLQSYVGGLVGCNGLSALIDYGTSKVSEPLKNVKDGYVGGLVGCNRDYSSSSIIQHSGAIVAEFTDPRIGSLIGLNNSTNSVTGCTANRGPMVGSGNIDSSNQVDPNLSLTGYSGGADAIAAALPPEQPEGVKGRRKKSRREIG